MNAKGLASYCQECGACAAAIGKMVPAAEDERIVSLITDEVTRILKMKEGGTRSGVPSIPLGVSNRHMHITQATFHKLFGEGTVFESYRELYQSGEFASRHVVTLVGSRMKAIQGVRILGPVRSYDQVELALTDAIVLGIMPPVRNSGDLKGSAPLTIVGPAGSVFLRECAIIASRHMHMNSKDALLFGVKDGVFCRIRIGGEKSTVFENVLVRVNDAWKLQLHLDTDDANAANVRCAMPAEFNGMM